MPMLIDLLILAAAAVGVSLVLGRLRLPVLAGLLAAGALVGPHGFNFVSHTADIESFAEIGVVLLLFTIGLEFTRDKVRRVGRAAAFAGVLQILGTVALALVVLLAGGQGWTRALFFGLVFALSSTAIVLRSLEERGELGSPHGRLVLATLIIQDLAIVPMILLVPLLAGSGGGSPLAHIGWIAARAVALIGLIFLMSRFVMPAVLRWVDETRSREIFLLTVLTICIGIAWLSMQAGLSLALGAFLAGVALADSGFAERAMSEVLPLRDVLASFFFISLGMLFDGAVLLARPGIVLLIFGGLLLGKWLVASLSVVLLRFPARVALIAGLGLAQFGEFGYILLRTGQQNGLVSPEEKSLVLCAGLLSMFVTPLLIIAAPHIGAGQLLLRPLERLLGARGMSEPEEQHTRLENHVVLAGYGPAGRMLAEAMRGRGIRYLLLELNSETVREVRAQGEPAYYADITSIESLRNARLSHAAAFVILISDQPSIARATAAARRLSPEVPILVRARYEAQVAKLRKLGATHIVVEESEAGREMVRVVCDGICRGGDAGRPGAEQI
jgi:CPA2 family monovalent cation:H+ antiporter-2